MLVQARGRASAGSDVQARTASSSDQAPTGMRSCWCECAKKHTRRLQRSPSVHSCVRYLLGCRLRSYTPCAYGHWLPCAEAYALTARLTPPPAL